MSAGVTVPIEAIVTLRRRLAALPARHPERQPLMASTAELYDISRPQEETTERAKKQANHHPLPCLAGNVFEEAHQKSPDQRLRTTSLS